LKFTHKYLASKFFKNWIEGGGGKIESIEKIGEGWGRRS